NAIGVADTAGTYQVRVVDNAGRQGIATFTIPSRSITLSPTESGRGSTVTVTGTGFSANSTVTFTYAGTAIAGVTATTDANGAFTASFAVPETAGIPSSNAVTATDAAGLASTATHRVPSAAVTVSPASAPAGSSVTVRGTGFPGFAAVAITVGAIAVTPTPTPLTRADGSFEATITVPAQATGVYIVTATAGGVAASTQFTQTARPTTIADVVSPISQQLVRIWGYDAAAQAWRVYDPSAPALSDLTALVRGQGYWVNVNAAVTWTYAGNTYNLSRGWNLIGWLGP
ncbi:MAG: IPT/TIG domain-containing protein, partial [Dehalococcoidia bacterium]